MNNLTEIATNAKNLTPKRTKKQVLISLNEFIKSSELDLLSHDNKLRLTELYQYLLPKPVNKSNIFKWIQIATNPESDRYQLNRVHVDGEYITATDGHRMHVMRLYDFEVHEGAGMMEPGYYNAKCKLDKSDDGKYFDYKSVMQSDKEKLIDSKHMFVSDLVIKPWESHILSDHIDMGTHLINIGDYWYQYRFFLDAVGKVPSIVVTQYTDGFLHIKFRHHATKPEGKRDAIAIITPIKQ